MTNYFVKPVLVLLVYLSCTNLYSQDKPATLHFTSSQNTITSRGRTLDLNFMTTIDLDNGKLNILRATPMGEQSEIWIVRKQEVNGDLKNGQEGTIVLSLSLTDTTLRPSVLTVKITKGRNGLQNYDVTGFFETSPGKSADCVFVVDKGSFQIGFTPSGIKSM